MLGSIIEFFQRLPSFTKTYIIGTFIASALANYKVLDHHAFAIWPPSTFNYHECYKLILSTQYNGPFGFFLLFQIYFIALLGGRLEGAVYYFKTFGNNGFADYLWMLGCFFVGCNLAESLIVWNEYYYFSSISFNMCIFYFCCRLNYQETIILFVVLPEIKQQYLPILLSLFIYYNSGNVFSILIGVIVGELYYLLRIKSRQYDSQNFQSNLLSTPTLYAKMVNWIIGKKDYVMWKLFYKDWNHFAFQGRGRRLG